MYDAILIPALSTVRADMSRGRTTDDDVRFVLSSTCDVVASLEPGPRQPGESPDRRVRILGCPAIDAIDELAFMMFQHVLDPARAGADEVGTSLRETREHLMRWLPILNQSAAPVSTAAA